MHAITRAKAHESRRRIRNGGNAATARGLRAQYERKPLGYELQRRALQLFGNEQREMTD